jgi:beta-galactosidase
METNKNEQIVEEIHIVDYKSEYESKIATAKTMIFDTGRDRELLNGQWNYAVDQLDAFLRGRWYKENRFDKNRNTLPLDYSYDEWPIMNLPCCWNNFKSEYMLYEGSMVFTRRFYFKKKGNERVFLKVGAANYVCRVFLNKKYVGMHRGGNTPFFIDITDEIEEDNRIILQVDNTRRADQVPTDNTDWFNYGGVYRDIALIRVPRVFIKDYQIGLVSDGKFNKIFVKLKLSEKVNKSATLHIDELGICREIVITGGEGEAIIEAEVELWSPNNVKLYRTVVVSGEDEITDYIGFREVRVEGQDILLNGESIFLRGISCHEESVENGKSLTDEERIQNISIAHELSCNFMRLAHYPHHENSAILSDQNGMLLWEEIPVYWAIQFEKEATFEDASNQLRELIRRDYNRASVIIWSVGNENPDTDGRFKFMTRLTEVVRAEDATRLVSAACLVNFRNNAIEDRLIKSLDIIGQNEYCGWYVPDFNSLIELFDNSKPDKPVIITECGADALAHQHGSIDDKGTEECQANIYKLQTTTIKEISYIKGMTPWILYDFRCPRRTSIIQNYYNRKGLLNPQKTHKKQAFYVLQKFYEEKKRE